MNEIRRLPNLVLGLINFGRADRRPAGSASDTVPSALVGSPASIRRFVIAVISANTRRFWVASYRLQTTALATFRTSTAEAPMLLSTVRNPPLAGWATAPPDHSRPDRPRIVIFSPPADIAFQSG